MILGMSCLPKMSATAFWPSGLQYLGIHSRPITTTFGKAFQELFGARRVIGSAMTALSSSWHKGEGLAKQNMGIRRSGDRRRICGAGAPRSPVLAELGIPSVVQWPRKGPFAWQKYPGLPRRFRKRTIRAVDSITIQLTACQLTFW